MRKTVVDLFAGAGGFGLGFRLAGYELIYSLEVDLWASQTLAINNEHEIVNEDISLYRTARQVSKLIKTPPSIIIGGPPCQGFSIAGKRIKEDPRNQLYLQFLNWVKILKPEIFIIENVRGLLTFTNRNEILILDDIEKICRGMEYSVNIWELNALNYGVPQNRKRVFVVGSLNGIKIPIPKPTHSTHPDFNAPITVGEAILDLPLINAREGEEEMDYTNKSTNSFQKWCRQKSKKVYNHVAMNHTQRVIQRYENIINGFSLDEVSDELKVRKRNGNGILSNVNYNSNYRHLKHDQPSYTIPAHFYSSFIHPHIPRNITTREAARLQSFPDNYIFKGKRTMMSKKLLHKLGKKDYLSQYNQVGNAVPPILAKKIANHLKKYFK